MGSNKMADKLSMDKEGDLGNLYSCKNDKEKLNFSEKRSKIRLESVLTEKLRKSMQSCKVNENEEKVEGFAVFF